MNQLSKIDVAWLAGLYEGEGCCSIKENCCVTVEIQMTDIDVLEKVQRLLGMGSVSKPKVRKEGYKPAARFLLSGDKAMEFLLTIKPWLGSRRNAKVEEAILHRKNLRKATTTHCINGHLFTPDNIRMIKNKQRCRTCLRKTAKSYKEKRAR